MHVRIQQEFFAAGHIFTSCYDDIAKDITDKPKIIIDALVHQAGIEVNFWHAFGIIPL